MFSEAGARLARHRICLERDVRAGIIPEAASTSLDASYATLSRLLTNARLELEAAGPAAYDHAFAELFVGGCSRLGQRLFRDMYDQSDALKLRRTAVQVSGEARALMGHLRARIERVA